MRRGWALLLVGTVAAADTSRPSGAIVERSWLEGQVVAGTNDAFEECVLKGDVLALRIRGRGESCAIRRASYPLRPCRVRFRVRWTNETMGHSYPSVHLLFDPPATRDSWWTQPVEGGSGGGRWAGGRQSFLFHYASDPGWRRVGVTPMLDGGPPGHDYHAPKGVWVDVSITVERSRVVVHADGVEVARCDADLSGFKTFTWAIGDQTSTRMELDEVRIEPR